MSNLWTGEVVGFQPLFVKEEFMGFAIASKENKVFYDKDANYNALLSEAKSVIVFDGYAINRKLNDFVQAKHNLRTLYFQVNSQNRLQTVKYLIKYEYYTEESDNYTCLGNTGRIEGSKQTILEASFIRNYYLKHHKEISKEILKIDNSLLKEFSLKHNLIRVNQLAVRSDMSEYQLMQWNAERKLFHLVGHPVVSITQLSYKQQQDKTIQNLFEQKNLGKSKYESLIHYLDVEELDLQFDTTATATGRILCRADGLGLFAPDNSYKQNFLAPKGYAFISADYSKQEASILAYVTDDKRLQKDLQNKHYYAKLAKLLTGVEDKQTGKDLFYAMTYGISDKALADKLGVSEERAEDIKYELKERYANLTDWLKKVKTLKTNYFGRKLYESTANAYVQSTAADIVRLKLLETINFNPICVFSDNIIFSVPAENVTKCKDELKTILEDIKPFKLSVTMKCSENLKFS